MNKSFDWRLPAAVLAVSVLMIGAGSVSLLFGGPETTATPDVTAQPTGTPYTPIKFQEVQGTGGVTYVLTPLVTRWVTYPAPTETEIAPELGEWNPTPQAPGLSTLYPWQTPYPTLVCVTGCP